MLLRIKLITNNLMVNDKKWEKRYFMRRLLIRADDLGYCEAVNYGIAKAVSKGLVKSVGVMCNMPSAKHGLKLLDRFDICLGQHTNICLGKPVLSCEEVPSLCQANGEFHSSKTYREAYKLGKDFVVLEEVVKEIEAQYKKFLELTGQQPSYFEGHALESKNFSKGLSIVANKYNLPYLAMNKEGNDMKFRQTNIHIVRPKDFNSYDENPFSIFQEGMKNMDKDECDMFIFHPGYIDAYLLRKSSMTTTRAKEVEMLCDPETKSWLDNQDVTFVTYNDLK